MLLVRINPIIWRILKYGFSKNALKSSILLYLVGVALYSDHLNSSVAKGRCYEYGLNSLSTSLLLVSISREILSQH